MSESVKTKLCVTVHKSVFSELCEHGLCWCFWPDVPRVSIKGIMGIDKRIIHKSPGSQPQEIPLSKKYILFSSSV
jgi:hypothetical protein